MFALYYGIIDVSNGGYHTFVQTSNNEIHAFENNEYSQLGPITNAKQLPPIRVFGGHKRYFIFKVKSKATSARSISKQ